MTGNTYAEAGESQIEREMREAHRALMAGEMQQEDRAFQEPLYEMLRRAPKKLVQSDAIPGLTLGLLLVECVWLPVTDMYRVAGFGCEYLLAHPWQARTIELMISPPRFDPDVDFPRDSPP